MPDPLDLSKVIPSQRTTTPWSSAASFPQVLDMSLAKSNPPRPSSHQPTSSPAQAIATTIIKSRLPQLERDYESALCKGLGYLTIEPDVAPFPKTRFGSLPSELRLMIYAYVVGPERRNEESRKSRIVKRQPGSRRFTILGVCRQLYFETRPIFFSSWTFYLENAKHIFVFLIRIGQARVYLRELHIAPVIVARPAYHRDETAARLDSLKVLEKYQKDVDALVTPGLDPLLLNARLLLRQCERLERIHFDVYEGSEHYYIRLFEYSIFMGVRNMKLLFQDLGHWCIIDRPYCKDEKRPDIPPEYCGYRYRMQSESHVKTRLLTIDLKTSPAKIFEDYHSPALTEIIDKEIMKAVRKRSKKFPNL